ncbi:DUF3892 domain-containing protein [Halomonas sp. TRM85114]|uniref:DUF3892 domain-containing protein n=1 Tax=Halomonas jincaotanensis TaxID=2810616 RepID=UPI001BD50B9C|nr:DUF3892 domain-containing protein [Halomonas jincaotanensis]MBS9405480.1 DUF3892 domain-containing protein [Halomonas jincaotanensis]
MADRRVTATGKDRDGDITKLCNSTESWPTRSKADAVRDIDGKTHSYYVDRAGHRTDVHVVTVDGNKHLRTTADKSSQNNLDNLPDC